ncbi:alpha/beta fold hydrolase [uncultured Piscinibacter sp.]|uniref:alpha/beta fold hydrolase n=1 Tax=uncultured Piscinibacter sp. TaxID=1131835 RepID=UPI0026086797|nr:alpha/beta fold hydrolase [uncultured Piscinibacter sp.]
MNTSPTDIRFVHAPDGARLAYSVTGTGPHVTIKAGMWLSHLEFDSQNPLNRHWRDAMEVRGRFVRYDARGCGLSDWAPPEIDFDAWVRDLETVADAVAAPTFTLFGYSQGAAVAIAYAARHPERVGQLILYGGFTRGRLARAKTQQERDEAETMCRLAELGWAKADDAYRQFFTSQFLPAGTREQHQWFNELQRVSSSPENAVRCMRAFNTMDVTQLLPQVGCPTLVLHAKGDVRVPFAEGMAIAAGIRDARLVPIEGVNHVVTADEPGWQQCLDAIEAFLPRVPPLRAAPGFDKLSERQAQILDLLARGSDNAQIAAHLGVSDKTVRNQVSAILAVLGIESRGHAIVRAREAGFGQ